MTNNGPKCYCDVSQDYWQFGDFCEHQIHKNGLIAGFSVVLILLVLGLLTLAIYLVTFRKTAKKILHERDEEQMKNIREKWEEDGWEWRSSVYSRNPHGFDDSTNVGESAISPRRNMKSILDSNLTHGKLKIQRLKMNTIDFYSEI
ncbi:uncharacterized protein LOC144609209 [Rhinoraja longicauda]